MELRREHLQEVNVWWSSASLWFPKYWLAVEGYPLREKVQKSATSLLVGDGCRLPDFCNSRCGSCGLDSVTQGSFLHPVSYYLKLNFCGPFFKVSKWFCCAWLTVSHTFFDQSFVVSSSSKTTKFFEVTTLEMLKTPSWNAYNFFIPQIQFSLWFQSFWCPVIPESPAALTSVFYAVM